MRFQVLACDYDGTLASLGRVAERTVAAIERLRSSGRKLVLVTGRQLDDLIRVFPHIALFERVVAEDGAVLYRPGTCEVRLLGEAPPEELVAALRARGVDPLSVGRVIVATGEAHESTVRKAISQLGVTRHVSLNKGAVMVLPAGVNKGTGLTAALGELALSASHVVGVGDAENDQAFLRVCACAVAVANALPAVRAQADFVTSGENGAGVVELIDRLVATDLRDLELRAQPMHIAARHVRSPTGGAP